MMTTMATTDSGYGDAHEDSRRSPRASLTGIRTRIVVGYVVLLASALAIAVLVTRQVLVSRLERDIDRALAQEVEELRRLAGGTDPETGEPFGDDVRAIFDVFLRRNVPATSEAFYTLVDRQPYLYSFNAPPELLGDDELVAAWAGVTAPTRATFETPAGQARTLAVPMRAGDEVVGVFVVTWFPADDREEVSQAIRAILIAGGVVLAVTTLLAWSLAGRVLRPVRRLTRTAQRISDSELSERIPVEGTDELAVLGHTFNDMLDRLEHGFQAQRRFLDDVAHELRTPITIARGHLEVLGDDRAEIDEAVAVVTDELDHMSRYVDELLVLAKSEQPDFLRLQPVDLGDLAETIMNRVQTLGDRRWTLDDTPGPGRYAAVADPGRIMQAVLNLAQNAVQHTTEGAEIGLGITCDGTLVTMWVRDTGPGVDPAVADQLFRRHTRGATSRISRPEGMGLGLSIVDAIARAHGGQVVLEQQQAGGAKFSITFPLDRESDADTPARGPEPPAAFATRAVDKTAPTFARIPEAAREEPE
jgi:signal transduction histidine kinase